jgi:hypothetical protein
MYFVCSRASGLKQKRILNQIFLKSSDRPEKRAIKKQGQMMTLPFSNAF